MSKHDLMTWAFGPGPHPAPLTMHWMRQAWDDANPRRAGQLEQCETLRDMTLFVMQEYTKFLQCKAQEEEYLEIRELMGKAREESHGGE